MNIKLIVVGKTEEQYLVQGIAGYSARLAHYCKFSITEIPELKNAKSLSRDQIKQKEGELILKSISAKDDVVLLDEHGRQFSSVEWARHLEKKFLYSSRDITFVIGGSYGFCKEVYERSNEMISLSRMTFSHQICRLIFAEQLYRVFTIIKGEPYHHE
jgi:23S rRNA (pseudouridine1915-N3)-methyltransferase